MFLDLLKKLSLKKIVKNNLSKTDTPSEIKIVTVGLLVDGTNFSQIQQLIDEFSKHGIDKKYIRVLALTKSKNSENTQNIIYFRSKDIGLSGDFSDDNIKIFEDYQFDMLVNYYNKNQMNLMFLTSKSKSDFRVGFSMEEKRLNHFMIDSPLSDYKLFTEELFKYLKVLNKI